MKRHIARHISIIRLAALALLAFWLVQLPISAHAQPTPGQQRFQDVPPIGVVFGQTLRVTVAHVGGQEGEAQTPPDVRVGVWLLDASGRVIARSVEAPIPHGEFRFFNFNRAALPFPGEPGTGRMQVRARLVMRVAEPYHFTDDPNATGLLVPSLELIDNNTGGTTAGIGVVKQIGSSFTIDGPKPPPPPPPPGAVSADDVRDAASNAGNAPYTHQDLYMNIWLNQGLARGQTLRYTWVNINDPDSQKRVFEPSRIRVRLLAANGSMIAQAEAPAVGVGISQYFDFNRDQIILPGEAGTGRLQVLMEVTVYGRYVSDNLTLKRGIIESFDNSAEVFDTLTGRTTVSFKPKEIVVVGLKSN